ncbi:hypothetical protein G4B88_026262 [Cannabis sativa]|uniref:Cytochrome P450 n=1 Tax=Cannabis sativa TaxID=3483 RepID=A0A7J6DN89_CANSA|nr:hypothetical protein G4B88_026262 [Cannabis sativa]
MLGQNSILQINGPLHKRVHALIGGFLRTPIFKATITQVIHHSVQLNLASWSNIQLLYVQDQARKAKERLLKIVGRIVEERKATMEIRNNNNNNKERGVGNDVVDVLLQESYDSDESRRLPLDFITGNIIEMMIPGEETVPMAMTLAVKYLSDNPVVLDHLREENMELKKKKMIDNLGYFIPKNWCVLASFISVHMNEENYEKPYEFNPWRWERTGNTVNSNMFTPFGGGQRLCPGLDLSRLELAIFLHQLVTKYRWIAEKDEIVHFPTVKMKRKLPISVTSISMT